MIDKEILDKAIQTYGTESQLNMAIEECSEFIDAIMKFRRGRVGVQEVVTEIADVMIMMEQMAIIFGGNSKIVECEVLRKMDRLRSRISAYEKEDGK